MAFTIVAIYLLALAIVLCIICFTGAAKNGISDKFEDTSDKK